MSLQERGGELRSHWLADRPFQLPCLGRAADEEQDFARAKDVPHPERQATAHAFRVAVEHRVRERVLGKPRHVWTILQVLGRLVESEMTIQPQAKNQQVNWAVS